MINHDDEPQDDWEWDREYDAQMSEAARAAPLRPMHECLSWAGLMAGEIDGMTLEQAERIIRAAREAMDDPHVWQVAGVGLLRGRNFKEPVMLAVFIAIEQQLEKELCSEYGVMVPRRFRPFRGWRNSGINAAWNTDAHVLEWTLRALGVEGLDETRYARFMDALDRLHMKVNGKKRRPWKQNNDQPGQPNRRRR